MPSDDGNNSASDIAALTESVVGLVEANKSIMTILAQNAQTTGVLQTAMTELAGSLKGGLTINPQDPAPVAPDFENMNSQDVAQHIIGEVAKITDASNQRTDEAFANLRADLNKGDRKRELDTAASDANNPDFNDWLQEMSGLARDNKNLTVDQLLILARTENPIKAQELQEKYKPADEPKEEEAQPFLGLTPTSSGGISVEGDDKPDGKKSLEAGLEAAWGETIPKNLQSALMEHEPI